MRLVTDLKAVESTSRLIGIRLAVLTLRLRENWRQLFGDADTAALALAIVVINSERLLRSELDASLGDLTVPLPADHYAPSNISSIATAAGFNRETARRKLEHLLQLGMLTKDEAGFRLAPGFTQQQAVISAVHDQLDEVRRTTNELLREGIFALEP